MMDKKTSVSEPSADEDSADSVQEGLDIQAKQVQLSEYANFFLVHRFKKKLPHKRDENDFDYENGETHALALSRTCTEGKEGS